MGARHLALEVMKKAGSGLLSEEPHPQIYELLVKTYVQHIDEMPIYKLICFFVAVFFYSFHHRRHLIWSFYSISSYIFCVINS